jgi:hypothetical protein
MENKSKEKPLEATAKVEDGKKSLQEENIPFLLNMKLIYKHGVSHSKNKTKVDLLLAIHNSHYVVEQILRERAKDITFVNALHKIGFEESLRRLTTNSPYNIIMIFYNSTG